MTCVYLLENGRNEEIMSSMTSFKSLTMPLPAYRCEDKVEYSYIPHHSGIDMAKLCISKFMSTIYELLQKCLISGKYHLFSFMSLYCSGICYVKGMNGLVKLGTVLTPCLRILGNLNRGNYCSVTFPFH